MSCDNELAKRKKRRCFEEWMEGDHVLLQLDARKPGVEVPQHLKDSPALTLKLKLQISGRNDLR